MGKLRKVCAKPVQCGKLDMAAEIFFTGSITLPTRSDSLWRKKFQVMSNIWIALPVVKY